MIDEILEWVPEGQKNLVRVLLTRLVEAEREEGARLERERVRQGVDKMLAELRAMPPARHR